MYISTNQVIDQKENFLLRMKFNNFFRELAYQISESVESLGSLIGVRCAVIVGGMDMMSQAIALSKKPHIIVATPGRLQDHLENTKGFSLRNLKYLVTILFHNNKKISI